MMATEQQIEALRRIYLAARDNVLDEIINVAGVGTKAYYNAILKALEKELKKLQAASDKCISTAIPAEYAKGLAEVYEHFRKNNLPMQAPNVFASIHTEAIYQLTREMQYQMNQGLRQAGRRLAGQVIESRSEFLKQTRLEAAAEKLASGTTINDMKNALVKKLEEQGFMTVQYGNGPDAYQVPLDYYATLCARTIPQQAGNQARENQLTENGYDLVEMTEHYPTCAVCAQFQGRVYSISGKDARFPPLSKAFSGGYHSIHPQCTHTLVPFIEALQTEKEMRQAIERSNRPFIDDRSFKEVAEYNKAQAKSRQARLDRYQYERYRQVLGDEAPRSYRSFLAIKRAGGEKWEDLQYYFRNIEGRPVHCVKIDRELDKLGLLKSKGRAYPADNEKPIAGWQEHAERRLREAGLTKDEPLRWKNAARIMLKKYPEPNTQLNYYHRDGIIALREKDGMVLTVIAKSRFGNETKAILEVIAKHVKDD